MNKTFDKFFWISLLIFLLLVIGICFLPSILTGDGEPDFTQKGQIGDTIGGIMGPFVAIIAAWLTFIAFWVQFKANNQQRHDIAIERFESNLFEMIHIQQEITNGLFIEEKSPLGETSMSQKGRDVFQFIYQTAHDNITLPEGELHLTLNDALREWPDLKMHLSRVKVMWCLDHYFRHLYRIYKYIDDAENSLVDSHKKYEYASIVRATLSQYELILLFYNGFSHPKFKNLIEKYTLLNNMRAELLADAYDQSLYKSKMMEKSNFADEEKKDMSAEYRKMAFVRQSE